MAIAEGYKANFATLIRAVRNEDVCLMECKDAITKEVVMVVAAVFEDEEGLIQTVPLAKLFEGNPYEQLIPPTIQ